MDCERAFSRFKYPALYQEVPADGGAPQGSDADSVEQGLWGSYQPSGHCSSIAHDFYLDKPPVPLNQHLILEVPLCQPGPLGRERVLKAAESPLTVHSWCPKTMDINFICIENWSPDMKDKAGGQTPPSSKTWDPPHQVFLVPATGLRKRTLEVFQLEHQNPKNASTIYSIKIFNTTKAAKIFLVSNLIRLCCLY